MKEKYSRIPVINFISVSQKCLIDEQLIMKTPDSLHYRLGSTQQYNSL